MSIELRDKMPGEYRLSGPGPCVCVDPGVGGTGIAVWDNLQRSGGRLGPRLRHVVKPHGRGDWGSRMDQVVEEAVRVIDTSMPEHSLIVIEVPIVWAGSARSLAAGQRGELTKLAVLAGAIGGAFWSRTRVLFIWPSTWKGQMPKAAVGARIARTLGASLRFPDHVEDAIGMGLALVGRL